MNWQEINLEDIKMEVVSKESASIFSVCTCGNPEIDRYFRENAGIDDKNVCYAYRNERTGEVVGMAALCCSGIIINNHALIELVPAIKIDYFAVAEKYQDIELTGCLDPSDHYFISDHLLNELVKKAREIADS